MSTSYSSSTASSHSLTWSSNGAGRRGKPYCSIASHFNRYTSRSLEPDSNSLRWSESSEKNLKWPRQGNSTNIKRQEESLMIWNLMSTTQKQRPSTREKSVKKHIRGLYSRLGARSCWTWGRRGLQSRPSRMLWFKTSDIDGLEGRL